MTICNREELLKHMTEDLGVDFCESTLKADTLNHFDRKVNGEWVLSRLNTWLLYPDDTKVELGGDAWYWDTDPEFWVSEQFCFPFDSGEFDSYLLSIEEVNTSK